MDVLDFINRGGQREVPNPLFNPRSKRNIQPRSIVVQDLTPDNDAAVNMAIADEVNQHSIDSKTADKYRREGFNYNPWEDLDAQLAERQGIFTKFGNALAQSIVSEIGLGTIKGFSDLFDLIGQAIGVNDGDYSNPVSKFLEEKQEEFRNFALIYSDPNLHINNGGLLDAGWWASNMPSIVSTLTLLIPSTGITKGLSYIGKVGKVGARTRNAMRTISGVNHKMARAERLREAGRSAEEIAELTKLNGVQRFLTSANTAKQTSLFLENAITASLSRAMENYQEARQTYNDMYAEASEYLKDDNNYQAFLQQNGESLRQAGVDVNDRDAVAKYISSSAADRTFQTDWFNVGWDVIQMYGLRNAWKGLRNARSNPSAVRRAELDARKYFGKKPEEIAKLKAQRSLGEKAKEWVSDRFHGSKLIVGAQLNEGAEEALNYIATEEGMRFGRVLLGTEQGENKGVWDNIRSGFDGRLKSYLQAPELYDAAFWGVLGGVVFQAGGSFINRVSQKFNKSEADKNATNQLPWYQLDQLPENKRRIAEIEARSTDFANYKNNLDRINQGIDIYNSTENNEVRFNSEEEANVAREKLKDEFIASMTLRAMNSGNYDMLKSFLQDENVRKNLIESGVFGNESENGKTSSEIEQEAKEYIDSAIKRMDEIADMYEQELTAVDYASSRIGSDMLAEYMQIIANNNVNTQLALRQNQLSLVGINGRIAQLEEQFSDKLDPNINHANNIKVGLISSELGKLYAEKKKLNEQPNSLSKTISLENINKKIETLENELSNSELVFATSLALRYFKKKDGSYAREDNEDYFTYKDNQIINNSGDTQSTLLNESLISVGLSNRARTLLSSEELQEYKVLKQDADNSFDNVSQISPELNELYAIRAATELSSKMFNSELVRTVDEVRDYSAMLHNTMSEARITAIEQANKTIRDLYKKYGSNIEWYINKDYSSKNEVLGSLSEAERRNLDDALKVLALTKSYNRSLALQLELMFRNQDAIDASQDSAFEDEESEENATDLESDTDTITPDLDDYTGTTEQSDTKQEIGQNDDVSQSIDPQNISNRTPSYYAKFWFPKGVLASSRHSSTDNGGAVVYDNEDGTFTLDVRDDKKALNDSRFFANANEVDLLRPYEVIEKPILKKNKKGKLEVYKQGRLVNTDTLEYQAAQQAETQEEVQVGVQNEESQEQPIETTTEEKVEETIEPEQVEATNPSTGDVVVEPAPVNTENATPVSVYEDVIPDEVTTEDEIRMASLGRFQREFKANNDVDLDAIATEIINEEIRKGRNRQVVEEAVNKSLSIIKRVIERKRGKTSDSVMQSSIDEVIVQSSIVELTAKNPFIKDYIDAVRSMINEFCKELGINEYNGKRYINLEDLLRYVNTITNDSQASNMMFDALKVYLTTDEAKKEFITTDETQNSDTLRKNIAKSAAQRYQERLSDTTTQRVDIWGLRRTMASNKELQEFEEALEAIQKGDKLTYTREDNKIVLKDSKGRTIGTLGIPSINPKTGAYEIANDGWKYDIISQTGGNINSNLKTLFSRWLNEVNDASKALNAIIYELAFEQVSPERKKELLNKFINNSEIKAAKNNGFIDASATNEKLINGLIKLWRYQNYTDGDVTTLRNKRIDKTLNTWFSKLRNSYDGVSYLLNNENGEVEVANISDGEVIRASETNGQEAALPANKAIAGGVNPSIHKLAISSNVANQLTVSGMPAIHFSGVGKMNTFVLLPNRNGSYEYIQAYPADITDDYIGKDAKEIIKAIQDRIEELIEAHAKQPTQESFNAIKSFVKSVLSNHNGNSSLFWNLRLFEQGNTFGISLNNDTKVVINATIGQVDISKSEYKPNKKGFKQIRVNLNSKQSKDTIFELLNNLRFNLNPTYIASDNATNTILNGIAKRRNGKFEITIGNRTWSYNSFNEFILSNNLVRLNTKPNERGTSNFTPRGSRSQSGNQVLEIRINSTTTSPVESNTEVQSTEPVAPTTQNLSIPERAIAILNGTQQSSHKGNDIAALIFNEKQLKAFKELQLLPENIIFDENFNNRQGYETINAEYNVKTRQITVGKRWLDMFTNPTTRNQAIRKLIHEQLHYKLGRNKGYVRSVQSIYDEFKEYLDKNNVPKDTHIRAYLFEDKRTQLEALEEFLVESLTSNELAQYLNNIQTEVPTKRGAKNLWQKIMQVLSDIFGWGINKGSLYEKELNTIRNLKLDSSATETSTEEIKTEQEAPVTTEEVETKEEKVEEKIEVKDEEDSFTNDDDFVDFSDDLIDEFDSNVIESEFDNIEYTPEMQSIKDKAIANGTFMKAPNGKPTNLNERQWLQVRTKNFINWFGDWINNPAEASKIVDENGEPLVVYHRTPYEFNKFDLNKTNPQTGKAIYFALKETLDYNFETSGSIAKAEIEGKKFIDMPLFVNMRNPGEYTEHSYESNNNNDGGYMIVNTEDISIDDMPEYFSERSTMSVDEYNSFKENKLKELQHKTSYIISGFVKLPNQIKSATSNNGDFSIINDDIRYSSITEQDVNSRINLMSNVPSIPSVTETLPLNQQPEFASLVASAEIETSCR